ncbi:Zn-dependent protease [Vibrio inusitatus NBRC 102082]|uniref:Zn-dependent protease n=1 Tax=Vibrio inusitatus NBRC 102082 TaxID=1219070 RepID=A0A4Y3HZS4_9VIBR|nr:M48 family metallopeptidase [Vibrio inusitatus]GEA52210.1 Zn-dependent protease [Vibrio inusitatus NBRC 102082]
MRLKTLVLSLASVAIVTACATSPTGRNQVILFSDNQMSDLGSQSFEEMKTELTISKDTKTNTYVQCVTNAILEYVPIQGSFTQWEVVIFDSEQVNAFALPGGKIGVYTGLLNVAVNQDQLATVIGHEIAHVLAEHSNERMSHAQLANTGMQLSNIALANQDYRNEIMALMGVGVQYGVMLPYGRTQESEADIVGLELMAKAGFDPYQSVDLWKNMAKASGGNQPPELLSTHPSHDTRIKDLTAKAATVPKFTGQKPNCPKPD